MSDKASIIESLQWNTGQCKELWKKNTMITQEGISRRKLLSLSFDIRLNHRMLIHFTHTVPNYLVQCWYSAECETFKTLMEGIYPFSKTNWNRQQLKGSAHPSQFVSVSFCVCVRVCVGPCASLTCHIADPQNPPYTGMTLLAWLSGRKHTHLQKQCEGKSVCLFDLLQLRAHKHTLE